MKKIATAICLMMAMKGSGQSYQCLKPTEKQYFTNTDGYLRGIRIDSVQTYADSTLYYPYHTARNLHYSAAAIADMDTTGGSWVGKRVLALTNGDYLFDNFMQDTVIIKPAAGIGDEWVFYDDTTTLYYKATVTAIDTMTIAGVLDSVKTITINAETPAGPVTDAVNGFQLKLSKDHGFVQLFDLYMFPYHLRGSSVTYGLDYYTDALHGIKASQNVFHSVDLVNPTQQQLHDWNVGDVYEYASCSKSASYPYDVYCDNESSYSRDSIQSKTVAGSTTTYQVHSSVCMFKGYDVHGIQQYENSESVSNVSFGDTYVIDTMSMPEEYTQCSLVYYTAADTGCVHTPVYQINSGAVCHGRYNNFEGTLTRYTYQLGPGFTYQETWTYDAEVSKTKSALIYYKTAAVECGNEKMLHLAVNANILAANEIAIFPNPAQGNVTVAGSDIRSVVIGDIYGRTLINKTCSGSRVTMDVSDLPPGTYLMKINKTTVKQFIKQ